MGTTPEIEFEHEVERRLREAEALAGPTPERRPLRVVQTDSDEQQRSGRLLFLAAAAALIVVVVLVGAARFTAGTGPSDPASVGAPGTVPAAAPAGSVWVTGSVTGSVPAGATVSATGPDGVTASEVAVGTDFNFVLAVVPGTYSVGASCSDESIEVVVSSSSGAILTLAC